MFWFYTLVILSLVISAFNQGTNNNYGPYKTNWLKFQTCKGPKRGDCGKVYVEDSKNKSDVVFVLDSPIDCPVTKAKVIIGSKDTNSEKKMFNYVVDSPCKHFFFGPFLNEILNLTEKACKVDKGYYRVHVNMNDKTTKFLGSSFFYGNYTFKIYAHNKINNFFCLETAVAFERRNP